MMTARLTGFPLRLAGALLLTAGLAACGGGGSSAGDALTFATQLAPIPAGQNFAYVAPTIFGAEENYAGHRIGYQAGYDAAGLVTMRAGYQNGDALTALPASGTAIYNGRIDIAVFENFARSADGSVDADYQRIYNNHFPLTANFANRTLTGASTEAAQTNAAQTYDVAVNASYSNNALTGTMSVDGVTGQLRGVIDNEAAVAAAAGTGSDLSFAGGLILLR